MKSLSEVEPRTPIGAATTPGDGVSVFRITQPGSYYLKGNVLGVPGKAGIVVASSHVHIDLNGFELVGAAGSLAGIDLNTGGLQGVTIKNGGIRGWGSDGIKGDLSGADHLCDLWISSITGNGILINSGTLIERCRISGCTMNGISTSNNVIIQNTVSGGNTLHGISAGTASTVSNCQTGGNGGAGIFVGNKGIISHCDATLNGSVGIAGLDGSTISYCHADNSGQNGIAVGEGGVIAHCAANDNTGNGITAGLTSTVTSCSAWSNNGHGITISAGTISGCTARENGIDGINVANGSLVEGCTAASNGDEGIAAGSGCILTRCTAFSNVGDGIQAVNDSRIADNNCFNNGSGVGGGAGVRVFGSDCRVEGNNVTDNPRGIDVDAAGNLIIRNSASGTGVNYDIVANNKVGPILVAPDSLAINGDSGGAGVGTTNPWANLSY